MIPLLLTPHDWIALDANASMLSTRYYTQLSCEGLHPRYQALTPCGAWYALVRSDGAVVGLASAERLDDGTCCVDAFTHANCQDESLAPLYHAVRNATIAWNPRTTYAACAKDDVLKASTLRQLRLKPTERSRRLTVSDVAPGRQVGGSPRAGDPSRDGRGKGLSCL